jgi:predicted dehydrogenase
MVRLAIIGNGDRTKRHLDVLATLDGVDVVAVAGPETDASYQELFARSDVDVVDLCAPPGPAATIAIAAGKAGKRVIAEYPPGTSAVEFERVMAACDDHGGMLNLLLPERHQPLPKELKATLEAGKLGPLRYVHAASIWQWSAADQAARGAWGIASPADDGGPFLVEYAAGALNLAAWLFGDVPIATVFARSCALGEAESHSRYVSTVLSFADGSQAVVEVGLAEGFPANSGLKRLALTGMAGSAYFNERDQDFVIGTGGTRALNDDVTDGLTAAFSSWLAGGTTAAGANAGELAFAAVESLRTGQPVEVEQ